jgi:hypothetical protein
MEGGRDQFVRVPKSQLTENLSVVQALKELSQKVRIQKTKASITLLIYFTYLL